MATVITVVSSDEDDVEIIAEIAPTSFKVKKELAINSLKCQSDGELLTTVCTSTLLTTSVTISKVPLIRSNSGVDHLKIQNCQTLKEHVSDDEIICLETDTAPLVPPSNHAIDESKERTSLEKQASPHLEKSETPPTIITLDDEDVNVDEKTQIETLSTRSGSVNPQSIEVVFIDSDDGSDDSRDFIFSEVDKTEMSEYPTEKQINSESTQSKEDDPVISKTNESDVINLEGEDQPTSNVLELQTEIDEPLNADTQPNDHEVTEESPSGPGNLTEKLLKQLLTKLGTVRLDEKTVNCIKKKIMKYYNAAPLDFTQSDHFVTMVKNVTAEITKLSALPNNDNAVLQEICDKLREFLNAFQRSSSIETEKKLSKLYRMWKKLTKRIQQLEVAEVDSDSEYEDSYVMLGRYRKKACLVYDKICQLENKANHADRQFKQRFIYCGVGPVPIQRALEKYYNDKRKVPNFFDVYKLVKKVNTEQNLNLTPCQAHLTAQEVFLDFVTQLKRRRRFDDYLVSRTYLPLETRDPAEIDETLQNKLTENSKLGKKEEDVLSKFVLEQANMKNEESKAEENGDASSSEESDPEESEDGADKNRTTFMDSDEEMAYLENVESSTQPVESGPPSKKSKTICAIKHNSNPSS